MDNQIINKESPNIDNSLIQFTCNEIEEIINSSPDTVINMDSKSPNEMNQVNQHEDNKEELETESMNSYKTCEINKEIDQAKFNSQIYRQQMMQELINNHQVPKTNEVVEIKQDSQIIGQIQQQIQQQQCLFDDKFKNPIDKLNQQKQITNLSIQQFIQEDCKQENLIKQILNNDVVVEVDEELSDIEDEQQKSKRIPPVMQIRPKDIKEQVKEIKHNDQPDKQNQPLQQQKQQQKQIQQIPLKNTKLEEKKVIAQTTQGYLLKKSPVFFVGYHKRWCVLQDRKFSYYKVKDAGKQYGCIDFDQVSAFVQEEVTNNKITKIIINIKGVDKKFIFKGENDSDLTEWFLQLKQHIILSKGANRNLAELIPIKRFWREKRISPSQFFQNVDTGDLMLFKTKNFAAKFQRSLTGSDYDHVGILLRYNNQDIVLFEAAGKMGVGLISWKGFCKFKFHVLYDKLVVRHLIIKRSETWIGQLEKFIKYAIKKKYKVSLSKLFKKKAVEKEESIDNENRTFFCSELVAAAYKYVDLINKDIASSSFWPGSFSAEKNIQLQNGAKLSEEYLIDFTLQ